MGGNADLDPGLPWGHEFELRAGVRGDVIVDGDGREWNTMRDALWTGRLRMRPESANHKDAILELIHAGFTRHAHYARTGNLNSGRTDDLFERGRYLPSMHRALFYAWMRAEGLLGGRGDEGEANLTEEGWAVLRLLDATRPPGVRSIVPSHLSLNALLDLARARDEGAEEWRRRVEDRTAGLACSFVRRTVGDRPVIELVETLDAGAPRKRTVWVMAFGDADARDALFDWLANRVDRWPAFGRLAYGNGGIALAHHIVELMADDLARADASAGRAGLRPLPALTDQR